jgi:hypothetical protein
MRLVGLCLVLLGAALLAQHAFSAFFDDDALPAFFRAWWASPVMAGTILTIGAMLLVIGSERRSDRSPGDDDAKWTRE